MDNIALALSRYVNDFWNLIFAWLLRDILNTHHSLLFDVSIYDLATSVLSTIALSSSTFHNNIAPCFSLVYTIDKNKGRVGTNLSANKLRSAWIECLTR